jgi:beta-N-acetylhexosaminidase
MTLTSSNSSAAPPQPMPLVFGINGFTLSLAEKNLIIEYKPWGIILFRRNIKDEQQVKNLITSIKESYVTVKILIDEEGGSVSRLMPLIETAGTYPAAKYYGDFYAQNPEKAKSELYESFAAKTKKLLELGIEVNCAPVVDIGGGFLSDRAFSSDPQIVIELSKVALKAIKDHGGIATLKHIPGHGSTIEDSHYKLPAINLAKEDFMKREGCIFRALKDEAPMAMTAHIMYTDIDKENPATLSSKVINFIRQEIGFAGLIITDAIEMNALHQGGKKNLGEIAAQSLKAGCDLVLYAHFDAKDIIAIAEAIKCWTATTEDK